MTEKPKRIRIRPFRPPLSDLKAVASSAQEAGHRLRAAAVKLNSALAYLPPAMREDVRQIHAEMVRQHEHAHALYRRLQAHVDTLGGPTP